MTTIRTALAALALWSAASTCLLGQGDDEFGRKTLVGLSGVYVFVEKISEDAQRDGLDSVQIRTDVELKLRQAGVAVLSERQVLSTTARVHLDVTVDAIKGPEGLYTFNVRVALGQMVSLVGDPSVVGIAYTWSASRFGRVWARDFSSYVRGQLRDLTDQFINAYLAANPKR